MLLGGRSALLEDHRLEKVLIGGSIQNILSCLKKGAQRREQLLQSYWGNRSLSFLGWRARDVLRGRKSERRALDASTVKEIGRYLLRRAAIQVFLISIIEFRDAAAVGLLSYRARSA